MTPHPDDVTILFLDYDIIILVDVNPLGYCDVINAPTPLFQYRPFPTTILGIVNAVQTNMNNRLF